jgi:hypothetical protein
MNGILAEFVVILVFIGKYKIEFAANIIIGDILLSPTFVLDNIISTFDRGEKDNFCKTTIFTVNAVSRHAANKAFKVICDYQLSCNFLIYFCLFSFIQDNQRIS